MWDMRESENPIENQFALSFLALDQDELRLLFGTCHDQHFRARHPKLVEYLERALLYRERQIQTNLEDSCSVQDPFWNKWSSDEMLSAVTGLDRLHVMAKDYPKIVEYIRCFGLALTLHGFMRWMAVEDNQEAA